MRSLFGIVLQRLVELVITFRPRNVYLAHTLPDINVGQVDVLHDTLSQLGVICGTVTMKEVLASRFALVLLHHSIGKRELDKILVVVEVVVV